jgi:hypothetical protein
MSMTNPGTGKPAAAQAGSRPRTSARCAHATSRAAARAARIRPSSRSSRPGQHPPRRGIRGHRPEQAGLVTQYRQIGDRLAAVGQHDGHVHGHPTRIMTPITLPQRRQRHTELAGQPSGISDIGQQPGTGMPDQPLPVRSNGDLRA